MKYRVGDTRIKSGFLYFPLSIYTEKRWLEWAVWEEKLDFNFDWVPYRFINDVEEEE
jgi:hypothetical protein